MTISKVVLVPVVDSEPLEHGKFGILFQSVQRNETIIVGLERRCEISQSREQGLRGEEFVEGRQDGWCAGYIELDEVCQERKQSRKEGVQLARLPVTFARRFLEGVLFAAVLLRAVVV